MGYYVYRYTDKTDGIIKYVGIVYGKTRELAQRINEHKKDRWYKNGDWQIDYFSNLLSSRADCEIWESHLIAKYKTFKWYNKAKKEWGKCQYLEAITPKWIEFSQEKTSIPQTNVNHTDENLTLRHDFGSICKHKFTSKQIDEIIELISSFPTPLIYACDSPDNFNYKLKRLKSAYHVSLVAFKEVEPKNSINLFYLFKYVLLKNMIGDMGVDIIIKDSYVHMIYRALRLLSHYQSGYCWKPIDLLKQYQISDEDVRLNLSHKKLRYAFNIINNYTELFIDFNSDDDMSFKVNQKTYPQIVDMLKNLKKKIHSF